MTDKQINKIIDKCYELSEIKNTIPIGNIFSCEELVSYYDNILFDIIYHASEAITYHKQNVHSNPAKSLFSQVNDGFETRLAKITIVTSEILKHNNIVFSGKILVHNDTILQLNDIIRKCSFDLRVNLLYPSNNNDYFNYFVSILSICLSIAQKENVDLEYFIKQILSERYL